MSGMLHGDGSYSDFAITESKRRNAGIFHVYIGGLSPCLHALTLFNGELCAWPISYGSVHQPVGTGYTHIFHLK